MAAETTAEYFGFNWLEMVRLSASFKAGFFWTNQTETFHKCTAVTMWDLIFIRCFLVSFSQSWSLCSPLTTVGGFKCLLPVFKWMWTVLLMQPAGSGGCQTQGALTYQPWTTWSQCGGWLSVTGCTREISLWLITTVRHTSVLCATIRWCFLSSESKNMFPLSVLRLRLQHRPFPRGWNSDRQEPERPRYQLQILRLEPNLLPHRPLFNLVCQIKHYNPCVRVCFHRSGSVKAGDGRGGGSSHPWTVPNAVWRGRSNRSVRRF